MVKSKTLTVEPVNTGINRLGIHHLNIITGIHCVNIITGIHSVDLITGIQLKRTSSGNPPIKYWAAFLILIYFSMF